MQKIKHQIEYLPRTEFNQKYPVFGDFILNDHSYVIHSYELHNFNKTAFLHLYDKEEYENAWNDNWKG